MAERAAFLEAVRSRLHDYRPTQAPDAPWTPGTGRTPSSPLTAEQLPALFLAELHAVGGRGECVPDLDAARSRVVELVRAREATRLIRWDTAILEELAVDAPLAAVGVDVTRWKEGDNPRAAVTAADIGLGTADFAIAETGSLVLTSGPGRGRTVALLPPAFVAVVPAARVVHRVVDVIGRYADGGELPSSLCLVTGPSRSGDIEQSHAIGVHGPGQVHVILVG